MGLRKVRISYTALSGYLRGEMRKPLWTTSPVDMEVRHVYPCMDDAGGSFYAICFSESFEGSPEPMEEFAPIYGDKIEKPDEARYAIEAPDDLTPAAQEETCENSS